MRMRTSRSLCSEFRQKKIHDTMWVKFCDGRSPRTYPYVSEISSDIGAIRTVTRHPTTTMYINALPRSRDNSPEAPLGKLDIRSENRVVLLRVRQ